MSSPNKEKPYTVYDRFPYNRQFECSMHGSIIKSLIHKIYEKFIDNMFFFSKGV